MPNPTTTESLPTCPVCSQPAHAAESDDLDRHPACVASLCAALPDGEILAALVDHKGPAYDLLTERQRVHVANFIAARDSAGAVKFARGWYAHLVGTVAS